MAGPLPEPRPKKRLLEVSDKSALDLDAELAKKKKEYQQAKEDGTLGRLRAKTGGARNRGVEERDHLDRQSPDNRPTSSHAQLLRKTALYKEIKAGRVDPGKESLILAGSSKHGSDDDEDEGMSDDSGGDKTVEIVDSFGRTRQVPRNRAHLYEGSKYFDVDGNEADDDSDGPKVERPAQVIYGDTIQHHAFDLERRLDARGEVEEEQDVHFDSKWERRDLGVGFYQFSKDAEERQRQMESLKEIRAETKGATVVSRHQQRMVQRQDALLKQREKTRKRQEMQNEMST